MKNKIIILSGPVKSGKTTALLEKFNPTYNYAGGFATPDIDGKRIIVDLHTGEHHTFQIGENQPEEAIEIGKFRFLKRSFEIASSFTLRQASEGIPLIVVDEIGKLELKNLGFDPLIHSLMKIQKDDQIIIFVVRDYLLEDVIEKYGLQQAKIITKDSLFEIVFE